MYTNSEPDHAHKWFPCLDQPDLKAPYKFLVLVPKEWTVVSTTATKANFALKNAEQFKEVQKEFAVTEQMLNSLAKEEVSCHEFGES